MTITVYAFEGVGGSEETFTTMDPREAEAHARKYGLAVIAREFEYADSELVWDFREGADSE